jgi:hypothetical protein
MKAGQNFKGENPQKIHYAFIHNCNMCIVGSIILYKCKKYCVCDV